MNTESTTSPAPQPDSRPDDEIAKSELSALFASLGLTAEITGAHAAIEESESRDPVTGRAEVRKWAHVGVIVTIHRPEVRTGNARDFRPATSQAFEWRMGTGHADWKRAAKASEYRRKLSPSDLNDLETMAKGGSRLTPGAQVRICGNHLPLFVRAVNPAEVLARCCQEGQEASSQSFEDWASSLGYDTDSRKALGTYEACQQSGTKARKLVDGATFEKLADLACRL